MNTGKVYIIGAGCGKFDLITLRGLELLKKSDVIIYDSLIDEKVLEFAKENTEKIFVGKRAGKPSPTQESINKTIIEKASEGKKVARLKGGDPFVFGRGGEEVLALIKYNIPFDIVPGITSAVAVPELAGIPVTHRNVSRSFHVITGHTKENGLPCDMSVYARLDGTLVFLMGLGHLKSIADSLIENGKSIKTPVAVISDGDKANQKIIHGNLLDIAEKSVENGINSPAVIVVGDTAEYDFYRKEKNSLDGISVTVSGTKRFADRLSARLENSGAVVLRANILRIESYSDSSKFTSVINELHKYTMIVLTSQNGAEIFIYKLKKMKIDLRKLSHIRFAVIGNATAEVLENHGIYAEIIPNGYTSEELGKAIVRNAETDEKLLLLRAVQSTDILNKILEDNSISYSEVKIYDVIADEKNIPAKINTDFIVFASGSGVREFYRQGYTISTHTKAVCIGKSTAYELERLGKIHAETPEIQNADSIVELIEKLKG